MIYMWKCNFVTSLEQFWTILKYFKLYQPIFLVYLGQSPFISLSWTILLNLSLLSQPKLNHKSTQPNITKFGFDMKRILNHHPPPLGPQGQQYLSCYWPNYDDTLMVGSWEHLEQTLTITVTFVQATFVLVTFVNIRNISAVTDLIWMKL